MSETFGDNSRRESLQSTLADISTLPTLPLARPQSKHTFLNESEVRFLEPAADRFISLNKGWIGAAGAGRVNLNGAPSGTGDPLYGANADRPDKGAWRMINVSGLYRDPYDFVDRRGGVFQSEQLSFPLGMPPQNAWKTKAYWIFSSDKELPCKLP
jgi:hypothetical protein